MVEGWKSLFDTNIENHRPNQKMIKQLKSLQHEKLRILSSFFFGLWLLIYKCTEQIVVDCLHWPVMSEAKK